MKNIWNSNILQNIKAYKLGLGTLTLHRKSYKEADRLINCALNNQINYFDTSSAYSISEEILGNILKRKRSSVYIATKIGQRKYNQALQEIDACLKRLQTEYVDIMQLHYINTVDEFEDYSVFLGAYEALLEAQRAGKVRYIGITGHRNEKLDSVIKQIRFDSILCQGSIVQRFPFDDLFKTAMSANMLTIAIKPLAGGMLSPKSMALPFIFRSSVNLVLSGMNSESEILFNIKYLEEKNKTISLEVLKKISRQLSQHGCRECNYCSCQYRISIPKIVKIVEAIPVLGLSERGRLYVKDRMHNVKKCMANEACRACENACPYNVPVKALLKTLYLNYSDLLVEN